MFGQSNLRGTPVEEETEEGSSSKLRDWDSDPREEYDSAKFKAAGSRYRKNTGEFVRKRFGTLEDIVPEADSCIGGEKIRSVSDRIRRRKRTLTMLRSMFHF